MYKGHPDFEGCKDVTWNPGGNNMMFHDISFPIFILTNTTEVDFIINNVSLPEKQFRWVFI